MVYFGRVVGSVVATRKTLKLKGHKFLIVQPVNHYLEDMGDPLIAVDAVQAGAGEYIFYTVNRDAAWPFGAEIPVDACITGIIDTVTLENPCGADNEC